MRASFTMDAKGASSAGRIQRREFAQRAAMHQVRVSRKSLVAALNNEVHLLWWRQEPALRYLHPLWLNDDNQSEIEPTVRLDAELGLVYGKE